MIQQDIEKIVEILKPVIEKAVEETILKAMRHQRKVGGKAIGLMSLSQAADYLGVSRNFVTSHKRELKPVLIGRRWKYEKESLDRMKIRPWINA